VSVKHSLLALLNYTPTYGYQLHGLMEAALGDPWAINIGQIYSTLSRLERGGLVVRQLENASFSGLSAARLDLRQVDSRISLWLGASA
jgi:hypothetical protein